MCIAMLQGWPAVIWFAVAELISMHSGQKGANKCHQVCTEADLVKLKPIQLDFCVSNADEYKLATATTLQSWGAPALTVCISTQ